MPQTEIDYQIYENCRLWDKINLVKNYKTNDGTEITVLQVGFIQKEIKEPEGKVDTSLSIEEDLRIIKELYQELSVEDQLELEPEMAFYQQEQWEFHNHFLDFKTEATELFYKELYKQYMQVEIIEIKEMDGFLGHLSFEAEISVGGKKITGLLTGTKDLWFDIERTNESGEMEKVGIRELLMPLLEKEIQTKTPGMEKLSWEKKDIYGETIYLFRYLQEVLEQSEEYRLKTLFT